MDARPVRADELHHLASWPGAPGWYETFLLDFAAADGAIAGYLVATLRPSEGRTWFWACVTGASRRLVAIDEPDAPLPRRDALELRAPGLWTDVECEIPFDHVSVGLEAFGVAFDDPDDAIGTRRGERTPVGFDLEWETDGAVTWPRAGAYSMRCRVTGEVLVGDEQLDVDLTGSRSHCWGDDPWWRTATVTHEAAPGVLASAPVAIPERDDAGRGARVLRSSLVSASGTTVWRHTVE